MLNIFVCVQLKQVTVNLTLVGVLWSHCVGVVELNAVGQRYGYVYTRDCEEIPVLLVDTVYEHPVSVSVRRWVLHN